MVSNIAKATTKEEIIELIHPELLKRLPVAIVDDIGLNILLVENYFKGTQHLRPEDVKVTRIYSQALNQITQIDYEGATYKIT